MYFTIKEFQSEHLFMWSMQLIMAGRSGKISIGIRPALG